MALRGSFTLLLSAVIVFVIGCGEEKDAAKTTATLKDLWHARRHEINGISLFAVAPAEHTRNSIPMHAILRNASQTEMLVGESGYFLDGKIVLVAENGALIPYSKVGAQIFGDENRPRFQFRKIKLRPGETQSWEFDLTTAFGEISAGSYRVSVHVDVYPDGEWGKPKRLEVIGK